MAKYGNSGSRRRSLLSRIIGYVMISFIIPFILKRIQHRIIKEQMTRCDRCKRKMETIKKNEYYCKYCKIIKIDDREGN